jgi:hypothetical protein
MPTSVSRFLPSTVDSILIGNKFQLELACSSVTDMGIINSASIFLRNSMYYFNIFKLKN